MYNKNNSMITKKQVFNLFLDDIRQPKDVLSYCNPYFYAFYQDTEWVVVRNYNEFVQAILDKGIPENISFDHDLADEHYRPSMYNQDNHYSNYYTDGTFKEKTGYDCAKWLLEHIIDKNIGPDQIPKTMVCHSMNPVGRKNIENMIECIKLNSSIDHRSKSKIDR